MVLMLLPNGSFQIADAAIDYELWVNGVQVTSKNANNILGDGNFRYTNDKKTLYIKGYNDFSVGDKTTCRSIKNIGISGLTINAESECTLIGEIECAADTTITGQSIKISNQNSYTILGTGYGGKIRINGDLVKLSIINTDLSLTTNIVGYKSSSLEIVDSNVTVAGEVQGFGGGITLDGCYIKSPKNSSVSGSKISKSSEAPIIIAKGEAPETPSEDEKDYGIIIKDTKVTSLNSDDVFLNGMYKYEAETNTLFINGQSTDIITNVSNNGLIINTIADSQIADIYAHKDTTITGDGILKIKSSIEAIDSIVTIKNTTVKGNWLIGRNENKKPSLNIIGSVVSFAGYIEGFSGGIKLTDCNIVSPEKCTVKDGTVYSEGGTQKASSVMIAPDGYYYGFTYGSDQVTKNNFEELLGSVANYDSSTKTLTVTGMLDKTITNTDCTGLTIRFDSNSSISGLNLYSDTTLTGILDQPERKASVLVYNGAKLLIENADIDNGGSIIGYDGGDKLEIKDSRVSVYNVSKFDGGIVLNNTEIVKPVNGKIENGSICNSSGTEAKSVIIDVIPTKYGIVVGDTEVNSRNADDILGDGKVVYSKLTNNLYLFDDIDLSGCASPSIRNESCEGLTITTDDSKTEKTSFTIKGGLEIMADTFIDPGYRHMDYKFTPNEGDAVAVSNGASLTLNCKCFTAGGTIAGSDTGEQLKINYCELECIGDGERSAINGFKNGIVLENCKITEPEGAEVNVGAVLTAEGDPVEKLHIDRQKRYGVLVNLVQLTEDNLDDIAELFTKSDDAMEKTLNGEEFVSFDSETNTLTLKDVDLSGDVLLFTDSNLNIEGDVKFGKLISFMGENEFRISGSGTLTSTSESAYLYSIFGASLSISETTINSDIKAITDGSLTVFSSDINAPKGISEFEGGIVLKECSVKSPAKAVVGKSVYKADGSTVADNVVISNTHIHTEKAVKVKAVDATCETDGNVEYYQCTCGRRFSDETATVEYTDEELVIPATGHILKCVHANTPTCLEDGNEEYYICEICEKMFTDDTMATEITDKDSVVKKATGHNYGSPVYTWSDDFSQCKAECVCLKDSEHIISETKKSSYTTHGNTRIYAAVFNDPHFTNQSITVEIMKTVLLGDVNSDDTVDSLDAMLLARYAAAWSGIVIDTKAADLNADGKVDNADAMILARYVAGWDGYDEYIVTKTV